MPKAAPKNPGLNIDLLPKETIDISSNSFLHWVLTLGRYLVIVTEIVAVGTFLFSIYLSKEKNDLRAAIRSAEISLDNIRNCDEEDEQSFCEERFLDIQNQIDQLGTLRASQVQQNKVLTELLTLLPVNVVLDKLSIDGSLITFTGRFPTEQQLQTLVESFNRSTNITGLDIVDLTKEIDFQFTATAQVNQSAFLNNNGQQQEEEN